MEPRISEFWGPPIKLVEFHAAIGAGAARLVRTAKSQGLALKPLDAVHLSSATQMAVTAFHTYDGGLAKFSANVGFPIVEPPTAPLQGELFGGSK